MSKDKKSLAEVLPEGVYAHHLVRFVNGQLSLTKKGTIKIPIELGLEQIGATIQDVRAITQPLSNELVPLLVFVEKDMYFGEEE